ncbi:N-acetylornithine carbamoyltransferase [Nonlabens xiamenensis]|uniref:N-acetylornithine carbamoyltransferase n=1 Tax=Nonlabens xiamenensis TaxID=2341043 RepID=UPI000F60BA08|nr:N-acetylornithine carbamoyltransferase [Nonlabens xiamenensis]
MKHYTSIQDISELDSLVKDAFSLKRNPRAFETLGKGKTLVMLFFNASLRTRLSTENAAKNLGMDVQILNVTDSWKLEFADGSIMNADTSEHVREAAQVIAQYADVLAVRAFPSLTDKQADQQEMVLKSFIKYAGIPVVNMESATQHPLQALADLITIEENKTIKQPKVVLSWAPHPKALPHAVANSFIQIMQRAEVDLSITHPEGYGLDPNIVQGTPVIYDQEKALEQADFVYVKNWSSFENYGKVLSQDPSWMMTTDKLNHARFMHCLPVRRNVVVEDAVLDSDQSLVIQQAGNRTFSAQVVLKNILEKL